MSGLTSSELASRGGVNLATVRFYERRGLLPKPPRSTSGYRIFPDEAVRRIHFIKHAQALGFSLEEVQELVGLWLDDHTKCSDVRQRAEQKIAQVQERINALRAMKKALTRLVAACSCQRADAGCPLLETLQSQIPHKE
jgi:Hg(II)-responsive transcriptional regulator